MGDGVTFDSAITSGDHLGPWKECTICDISSLCYAEACHNDGHWVEIAFPEDTQNIDDCKNACLATESATALQYNGQFTVHVLIVYCSMFSH